MKRGIIGHLVLKDWRLNRLLIALAFSVGALALVLARYGGQTMRIVGSVWFFVILVVLGSMLPSVAILNERKKQTLAFIMSLPVTSVQYGIAKLLSIAAMFVVPWLALLTSALILIANGHIAPQGTIPMLVIVSMLPMIGFWLLSATALAAESEGWLIAASVGVNSSYWFAFFLLSRIPSLSMNWSAPAAVWNASAMTVLAGELGSILLILILTLFIQSRKRDFT